MSPTIINWVERYVLPDPRGKYLPTSRWTVKFDDLKIIEAEPFDAFTVSTIPDFRGCPAGSPCYERQQSHSPAPLILSWRQQAARQATRDSGCGVPEPPICVLRCAEQAVRTRAYLPLCPTWSRARSSRSLRCDSDAIRKPDWALGIC